ncbi:3'(2'),5'-bisphosphate nucleotidase CysQ [Roseomonas terrae]|jgi:3'(2'), 5'-bisphosphate nucleotidase|uniref:3'(2'),5'-bisphosphate nucleotidase CysQ n=1 Tax=Neoroseomonas terrae TaxID=424799 RepID=A0ABS5EHZ8_9PROT|nr:3'(2'),5'-bisphosphate nucleotidase CysQ [Neoroseomonas terrae]MBR0650611.1 3'(2'),5'-bisphosphate nucleotidase CysQ [Neoroseomonas terrae]
MDDDALLALATRLADQAAAAINAVRAAGFAVERKTDRSPVTEADRLAEALIVEGLRSAAPHIPVIAEEEIEAGTAPTDPGTRFWLVDPLDGTREFAAGRDNFTVNVGLVEDGRAVLGAVAVPATGELFWGRVGAGAWKRDAGGTRPIAVRAVPQQGVTVMGSHHYQDDPRMDRFLAGRRVARVVNIGSAEKFCRVAEGSADLYPRFGPTMEWDTAAPQAVLEAAGGTLRLLDGGGPLVYGKAGWINAAFVCEGRQP